MKRISEREIYLADGGDEKLLAQFGKAQVCDGSKAIAQAQLEADQKWLDALVKEIEEHIHPEVNGSDYETERFIEISHYDWQAIKQKWGMK